MEAVETARCPFACSTSYLFKENNIFSVSITNLSKCCPEERGRSHNCLGYFSPCLNCYYHGKLGYSEWGPKFVNYLCAQNYQVSVVHT